MENSGRKTTEEKRKAEEKLKRLQVEQDKTNEYRKEKELVGKSNTRCLKLFKVYRYVIARDAVLSFVSELVVEKALFGTVEIYVMLMLVLIGVLHQICFAFPPIFESTPICMDKENAGSLKCVLAI